MIEVDGAVVAVIAVVFVIAVITIIGLAISLHWTKQDLESMTDDRQKWVKWCDEYKTQVRELTTERDEVWNRLDEIEQGAIKLLRLSVQSSEPEETENG